MRFAAPIVVVALLMGGLVPTSAAAAPGSPAAPLEAPTTTDVDNADLDSWTYAGDWTHAAGESWTVAGHGGTESYARTASSSASLTFTGTSVQLFASAGPNTGRMQVWVDCGEPITVDLYTGVKRYQQAVATFDGLPAGPHTLVVEVLGTRNGGSSDTYGTIDFARVVDDPALADPSRRWQGTAADYDTDPLVLRRTGCGSQSDLVSQLKLRSSGGWFDTGDAWGAVNGHSAMYASDRAAPGPIVIAGKVREAASLAPEGGDPATLDLFVPDEQRSLLLWLSADSTANAPLLVGALSLDDMFLQTRVLSGSAGTWARESTTSEAVRINPGEQKILIVDLADDAGAPSVDKLTLWTSAIDKQPELLILQGRVSDLSAARLASEVASGTPVYDDDHVSARAAAFSGGPVGLARVLADSAQPAWTSDGKPVPFVFGGRLTVEGTRLDHDALSVTLPPAAWPSSTSTVHIRMETAQRCRSLVASVGIDDASANRSSSSVSISALGDGEPLPLKHNGIWSAVDFPGSGFSPVVDGPTRQELAAELQAVKLAAIESSDDLTALTALVNAQANALAATASDRSMAVTSYPVASPLVLGSGFSGNRPDAKFVPADEAAVDPRGEFRPAVDAHALDGFTVFPLSIDLMTERMRDRTRTIVEGKLAEARQLESPLVREVELVITGTPGAIVNFADAGLDCVSTQTGPRWVMPLWSQLGTRPLFLPSPRTPDGSEYWQLGANPMWWDMACPAGPSTGGLQYTGTRTRTSNWSNVHTITDLAFLDAVSVQEVSTATLPACGLPADQKNSAYSEFTLAEGSDAPPAEPGYAVVYDRIKDPVAERVSLVGGDWTDELKLWAENIAYDTMEDPLTFMIWAALAPFDLPAAIVLNPFTQHALPVSAQLAVGVGLMGASTLVAEIAAVSTGGRTALKWTSAQAAEAAVAEGRSATLTLGEDEILIPLKKDADEVVADLALEQRSTALVTDTTVISSKGAKPGFVEETFGDARMCARELSCRPRLATEYPGAYAREPLGVNWEAPPFPDLQPEPVAPAPVVPHIGVDPLNPAVGGFWERYPNNELSSVVGNRVQFVGSDSEAIRNAWFETEMRALDVDDLDAARVYVQAPGVERVNTVALVTDGVPRYVSSDLPPSVVVGTDEQFGTGLVADGIALSNAHAGMEAEFNLYNAIGANRSRSAFVLATPDEAILTAALAGDDAVKGRYVYQVSAKGGFDVRHTLAQGGIPDQYRTLSNTPGVLGRAEAAYLGRIPGDEIVGWKKYEFFPAGAGKPARMEVVASSSELTAADRTGHPITGSTHDWAVFDWFEPRLQDTVISVSERPSSAVIGDARRFDGVTVFTKNSGWEFHVERQDVLTPDYLRSIGFQRGTWRNIQDLEVWVPTSGEGYTVNVSGDFIPSD